MPNISSAGAKKRKTRHSGSRFKMSRQAPSATQLAVTPSSLISLVDELLLNIIDHIDSHQALCFLAATCQRFQDLVEPFIWRDMLVLTGRHARYIAQALDSREERVSYVRKLAIRYTDEHKEGIEELNHFLGLMGRLRELHIESPCPNNEEWRSGVFFDGWCRIDYGDLLAGSVYQRVGVERTVPMLQRLTLHGHGSGDRKFLLGNAKAMFFHPTLKSITLSCLNFEADMDEDMVAAKQNSTPLQSLTLVECNVDVRFLDVVLSLPKALKELSIGERLHVFGCSPSMDPKKRTSSAQFLTALQRQAESLQRLVHVGGQLEYIPARDRDPGGATKFRSLTKLEALELGFESHLNYYLRANGFPPSLKALKMLDAALSLNSGPDMRSMADVAFHSITTLVANCMPPSIQPGFEVHLHFSDHSMFRLFVIAHPAEKDHLFSTVFLDRPTIYKIATMLKSRNAKFLVMRETFPSGTSYIPPYMYGEEIPVDQKMYDSDDYWRFSNIDYRYIDDENSRAETIMSNRLRVCRTCESKGLGVESCRSADEGIICAPCARSSMECIWDAGTDGDGYEHSELEAETEAGIQQVLFM